MTLEQFIAQSHLAIRGFTSRRAHVTSPGFSSLYVRRTMRYFKDYRYPEVLDLATMEVKHPGKKTFTKLVGHLNKKYPGLSLYVESVMSPRFQRGLLNLGFQVHDEGYGISPCFFLPAPEPVGIVLRTTQRKPGEDHVEISPIPET